MPRWPLALLLPLAAVAVPPDAGKQPVGPSPDATAAANRATVEGGLKATVWASEPLLANPVAFTFDEQGRCYVAETYRHSDGVTDTRGHMYWLDDDIANRTVADRLAMYKKHKYPAYEKFGEQLRLVWDSTGKGVADKSSVFAGPFNRPEDGLAAGVLARKGDVYFSCIPDLYRLRDTKGANVADVKESLSTGYGVRVQFIGHDLHGLIFGPDGKLYFSIGDRGFTVKTKEGKTLANPDSGAVLRCDSDGANLEIVHVGLRNPQELAFDDLGNLFTYDNNSDSGDQARWVQIVEGGDSGWRCGYQYGTLMHHSGVKQGNRGPWNTETIWHVPGPDGAPPAYVVPPLKHFGNGPSGITFYPGVGLDDRYKGHFFATDFTAQPGNSVIWSLAVKPKGASFEVVDLHPFVRNMVPTDCEFGPDGAFYWLDWTGGWDKPKKGRIFRVADEKAMQNPAVKEAQTLLAEGLGKKSVEELAKLLSHPHRKVRQEAQFELAGRKEGVTAFEKVLKEAKELTPRLHAVWGMSQVKEQVNTWVPRANALIPFATDADPHIRSAVVKAIGNLASRNLGGIWTVEMSHAAKGSREVLRRAISDPEPRVRADAAVAYAKVGPLPEQDPLAEQYFYAPLLDLLKSNNDQDAYIRQAAIEGLVRATQNPCDLLNAWTVGKAKYDTPAVRLGVVLALRKLQCRRLGEFLTDSDPRIVAEAARAIYDQGLMTPMEPLAKLAESSGLAEPVAYRAVAANFKLGGPEQAARVAAFAARGSEPAHLREFAMKLLAEWTKPRRLDPITGLRQELETRPAAEAIDAVRAVLPKLFAGPDAVRKEAVQLVAKLGVKDVGPIMVGILNDPNQPVGTRVEALYTLDAVKAPEAKAATEAALQSAVPKLRAAARAVRAKGDPNAATELAALLADPNADTFEKQAALAVLGTLKESKPADEAIGVMLDLYAAGRLPAELKLDVLEAARARSEAKGAKLHAPLRQKLRAIDQAARDATPQDPLARYREALAGGDADRGRELFLNNAAVYCQRCHKLDGQGGEVGPAVNGLGAKHPRDYLLESIVNPNAKIAEGYQSVILNLEDGRTISGVLRAKDAKQVTIVTPENKAITVPRDEVLSEKPDQSAMPADLIKKLSKRELRDLVEFLATLKEPAKGGGK
ncbi:MAG: HEAT repeat domain-containing protein [Gemmataceae bacterium]